MGPKIEFKMSKVIHVGHIRCEYNELVDTHGARENL